MWEESRVMAGGQEKSQVACPSSQVLHSPHTHSLCPSPSSSSSSHTISLPAPRNPQPTRHPTTLLAFCVRLCAVHIPGQLHLLAIYIHLPLAFLLFFFSFFLSFFFGDSLATFASAAALADPPIVHQPGWPIVNTPVFLFPYFEILHVLNHVDDNVTMYWSYGPWALERSWLDSGHVAFSSTDCVIQAPAERSTSIGPYDFCPAPLPANSNPAPRSDGPSKRSAVALRQSLKSQPSLHLRLPHKSIMPEPKLNVLMCESSNYSLSLSLLI